jgi:hypothetical protein
LGALSARRQGRAPDEFSSTGFFWLHATRTRHLKSLTQPGHTKLLSEALPLAAAGRGRMT